MNSLVYDEIFDSIISTRAFIKAVTLGVALIELKLILDQRKQIENLNNTFGEIEDLFKEIQTREDIPTDIKHKIDSLSDNQCKRGK